MKCTKIATLVILMLSTIFMSYPQSMLISCEKVLVNEDVEFVDKLYSKKNDYLNINIIVPQISKLANEKAKVKVNCMVLEYVENLIKEVEKSVDEILKDYPAPVQPYLLNGNYEVTNLDKVISFYIEYYQYTGGAHGITIRKSYNIDKETGEILKLNDLFEEGYDYKSEIDKKIEDEISKNEDLYFTGKNGFQGVNEESEFYIDSENLVIYYQSYEIAPYVAGLPEFKIPIESFDKNFKY